MKILTLIIKQKYFDEILAGTKKNEYREIRPKNAKRYIVDVDEDTIEPVHYDAIRFYVGYNKNRATALFAVKNTTIEVIVDDEDNELVYEEDGKEYIMERMNYELGQRLD